MTPLGSSFKSGRVSFRPLFRARPSRGGRCRAPSPSHRDQILELYNDCKQNLVRVHEELTGRGVHISYQALTAFCRRHQIVHEPKQPSWRYEFLPGEEMQHDTSPHKAWIGGVLRKVQTASVVLCYSELLYFQLYPRFTRFECKIVLTEACEYFGGSASRASRSSPGQPLRRTQDRGYGAF